MDTYGLISWAWQGLSQINLPTSKQLAASVQNVTRVFTGFASFDSSASFSPLDGWQRLNVKCKTITNGDLARYKRDLHTSNVTQDGRWWLNHVVSLYWIPSSTRVGSWATGSSNIDPFAGAYCVLTQGHHAKC